MRPLTRKKYAADAVFEPGSKWRPRVPLCYESIWLRNTDSDLPHCTAGLCGTDGRCDRSTVARSHSKQGVSMRIEVQHPAFKSQRLSVETASLLGGPKLLLNGAVV